MSFLRCKLHTSAKELNAGMFQFPLLQPLNFFEPEMYSCSYTQTIIILENFGENPKMKLLSIIQYDILSFLLWQFNAIWHISVTGNNLSDLKN